MLYKVVESYSLTIQMRTTQQYFPVVPFVMPKKGIILSFESEEDILKNESYCANLFLVGVYYFLKGSSNTCI